MMSAGHYLQHPFGVGSAPQSLLPPPVPRPEALHCELPMEMTNMPLGGGHHVDHPVQNPPQGAHHYMEEQGTGHDLAPVSQPLQGDSPPPSSGLSPTLSSTKLLNSSTKTKYVYGFSTDQYSNSLSESNNQPDAGSPSPHATTEEGCYSPSEQQAYKTYSQQFKSEVVWRLCVQPSACHGRLSNTNLKFLLCK